MHGPEQEEYVDVFHGAFPDFRVTLEDQIAEGNKVVNRWTVRGTHRGEFQGVAPAGKEVEFTGIHITTINEEGKLHESWENYNAFSLMQQLRRYPRVRRFGGGQPHLKAPKSSGSQRSPPPGISVSRGKPALPSSG